MIRVLTKSDIEAIIYFYHKAKLFDEAHIRQLYEEINVSKILVANIVNNRITSLLISNIIKNNYYLENVVSLNYNEEEVKDLIRCAVSELRKDERGLNVIYDNFPYKDIMHEIMIDSGFKCNFMNLVYESIPDKIELIKPNISLNDKSDDVKKYMYRHLVDVIKTNDLYLGTDSLIPDISTINLENTNVATIRNSEGKVSGTIRFGIVSDSLFLYSLYADDEETYKDLISLVKNLTNRNIEIGMYPSRVKLINTLEKLGFKKNQTDYFLKLT